MNIRRLLSYGAVAILATALWTTWMKEHPSVDVSRPEVASTSAQPAEFAPQPVNNLAATPASGPVAVVQPAVTLVSAQDVVKVRSDVLQLAISLQGGNVVSAELLNYPQSVTDKQPVDLLSPQLSRLYFADSGISNTLPNGATATIQYQASQAQYSMTPDQNSLVVTLQGKTANGLAVTKSYTLTRGSYAIAVDYHIHNASQSAWTGQVYTQLVRKKPAEEKHLFYANSYNGAAVSSPDRPYYKLNYSDMDKSAYQNTHSGGWVAMQEHYFLSAWVPANPNATNQFYSRVTPSQQGDNIYTVGFFSAPLQLSPGQSEQLGAKLYVGPEIAKDLAALAPGLDRTIDYGWFWWISIAIFGLMSLLHAVLANWGWTIVVTTILIKFLLYPLSAASFRSMARMRELQPKMQQLKERFGDDRQALSRATMEMYRNEKINPLGGCLPMLIQIPIFIAFYWVIVESVQLRQAPFIGWIVDLSVHDPYYVLPILMGVSMLVQQKLSPTSPDPVQAKMMMAVPVVFTALFFKFPAGLTLYWLVNNCVQVLQQWYVTKTFEAHKAKRAQKAKDKKKNSRFAALKK